MSEFYCSDEGTLAEAWSRVFLSFCEKPERKFSPFLVNIRADDDGHVREDVDLKHALDTCLEENGQQVTETVAKTIFPVAVWKRFGPDRQKFYSYYLEHLPDYVSMANSKNRYGLYFARLIGFGVNPANGEVIERYKGKTLPCNGNQLEFIIQSCRPGVQTMALQAVIFDPSRDQVAERRGFPCLQHVTFVRDNKEGTLSINAFYALQSFFIKAYGNWLGLCRLGEFVASQTDLRFKRLSCFAGVQHTLKPPKKGDLLLRLQDLARGSVEQREVATSE